MSMSHLHRDALRQGFVLNGAGGPIPPESSRLSVWCKFRNLRPFVPALFLGSPELLSVLLLWVKSDFLQVILL